MKSKLAIILICVIFLGSLFVYNKTGEKKNIKEDFGVGYTLDDGRFLSFSVDVPYKNGFLGDAIFDNELSIDEFISTLKYQETFEDNSSKIYKYNKVNSTYGMEDFYVALCNNENINDIFVARYKESLLDKCILKYDDIKGVLMSIKEGSLSNKGLTVIITDTSNRNNIYGNPYHLDKKVDGIFRHLDTIIEDFAWTLEGYSVDKNNTLEFKVNWEDIYGNLESGEYRIVKETSYSGEGTKHYITAEFTIE